MKKWKIISKENSKNRIEDIKSLVKIILENRGLTSEKDIKIFLNPDIKEVSLERVGIDVKAFEKFRKKINSAFEKSEKIIIFGDYDVDGICASAILWETLYTKSNNVYPYIPDRIEEGYGLSKKGIDNVLLNHPDVKIIITVDNGIVAHDAVSYAKKKGIDVVITDHHVKGDIEPDAFCILHTTSLCGAGIAWVIAKSLEFESDKIINEKLELAALATIADLVPLTFGNRAIVKAGLEILRNTKRLGLIELFKDAGIDKSAIGVYAIGHMIAPRLNATGRIQSAMNALRLLCTSNPQKAQELALLLSSINRERQDLTDESVTHAKLLVLETTSSKKLTIVAHESYNQGVIGLIASQLVESYYRPSFAIAKGELISKGSARSIFGVNIIELLRSVKHTLIEAGGHPMAAGFSVETHRLEEFIAALSQKAEEIVTDELLERFIKIDMVLPFTLIDTKLIDELLLLEPFGMGNPEPVFATYGVSVAEIRKIGRDQSHLKLRLEKDGKTFDAVGFRMADKIDINAGDLIDIAYTIEENKWNGKISIQLNLRDIKVSEN